MSTVNWCEEDYVHSEWIAEWYNTATSGAHVIAGVLGVLLHQSVDNHVFKTLVIVGIGSMLFHATLSFSGQLLDEIPMVIVILQLLGNTFPTFPKKFLKGFGAMFCAVMTWTAFHKDTYGKFEFFFFQFSYVFLCGIFALYNAWHCHQSREDYMTPQAKWCFAWGGILFLSGWVMWLIEQKFCDHINENNIPVQLHALWHVLSAMGAYYLCVFSLYMRGIKEGKRVKLVRSVIPRVVCLKKIE